MSTTSPTTFLRLAALVGLTGVAAGAFGAHVLRPLLSPRAMTAFATGTRYHLIHAVALLAVALLVRHDDSPWSRRAGWAFTLGTLLFSGSLYALALTGRTALGIITPLGGVALMIGWLCLALVSPPPSPARSKETDGHA